MSSFIDLQHFKRIVALSDASDVRYLYPSTSLLEGVLTEYSAIAQAKPPRKPLACPSKIALLYSNNAIVMQLRLIYKNIFNKRRCRVLHFHANT